MTVGQQKVTYHEYNFGIFKGRTPKSYIKEVLQITLRQQSNNFGQNDYNRWSKYGLLRLPAA